MYVSGTNAFCATVVVEAKARRKRSKGALNVFQFAETVEAGAWDDEQQKRDIEVRCQVALRFKPFG